MNNAGETAIIDIPDWNHRGSFFKAQICILLARLFRIFKNFHFLIAVPFEYIEDSYKNEEFFTSVLELIGRGDKIQENISIVLTKVDSAEESL
jgi:hypothetical protein